MRISVGTKLYFSVLSLFLLFAVSFIIFQQTREKQYKIDTLNLKLQDYNSRMAEFYSNNAERSSRCSTIMCAATTCRVCVSH